MAKLVKDARQIGREPLEYVGGSEAELRGEVVAKAARLFGYQAEAFGARGPLAKALAGLEIAPLRAEQVEDYMRSKVREYVSNPAKLVRNVLLTLAWSAALTGSLICRHYDPSEVDRFTVAFVTVLGGVLSSVLVAALYDLVLRETEWGQAREIKTEWRVWTMGREHAAASRYPRYVPVHVLNLAVQVKEVCPEAVFQVHELTTVARALPRPDPDPFLRAALGAEKYWLAVWDEREFEAKA